MNELCTIWSTLDCEVLALSETWLSDSVSNSEFSDGTYEIYRSDRNFSACGLSRGGGVLLAISKKLNSYSVLLDDPQHILPVNVDIVCAKILTRRGYFFIFNIYVPPAASSENYNNILEYLESLTFLHNKFSIILGDFNMPEYVLNRGNDVIVQMFNSFCSIFDYQQHNNVLNCNSRLLDLVISNVTCNVTQEFDSIFPTDAHHPSLLISVDVHVIISRKTSDSNNVVTYDFKRADYLKLYDRIYNYDWDQLENFTNVNHACDYLYSVLYTFFDECVPIRRNYKKSFPPWFTSQIRSAIKQKARLLRMHRKYKFVAHYEEQYKNLRAKIKKDIIIAHRNYILSTEQSIKSDPNQFWSYVRTKKNNSTEPPSMFLENEEFHSAPDIDGFASYFHSVFTLPSNLTLPNINPPSSYTVVMNIISKDEILSGIKKLKCQLSAGPDLIPSFPIKNCAELFSVVLFHIFNLYVLLQLNIS